MSTLADIEAAAQKLTWEEKGALFRSLAAQLHPVEKPLRAARLVPGPADTMLLEAPPGAPPMTTEVIKLMLEDFP